jgi:hypothetical protein
MEETEQEGRDCPPWGETSPGQLLPPPLANSLCGKRYEGFSSMQKVPARSTHLHPHAFPRVTLTAAAAGLACTARFP